MGATSGNNSWWYNFDQLRVWWLCQIMQSTNALRRNYDESEARPKDNKSWKWKHILKAIWDEKDLYTGNGLTPSVPSIILPWDAIALIERLNILTASKAGGNTGGRNELISVCDELLRQKFIDKQIQNNNVGIIKMLITKRTYKRKYVIGGAGIFGSIGNFFARMFSSNAVKQLASAALQAGKTAAKDIEIESYWCG